MSLYDEIESPLDDIETLRSIINIYANHRVDTGTRAVESGDDFYNGVTKYSNGNQDEHSQNEYINEFNQYIKFPNLDRLYENIKNPDFVDALDKWVAEKINEIKSMQISDKDKEDQILDLKKKALYPLARFKSIFNKFNTYHEFYDFFDKKNLWEVKSLLEKMELFPSQKDKYEKELNGIGLSEKQIQLAQTMSRFMSLMDDRFSGGGESMGFHIHPQNLQLQGTGVERENADMKFYLNAGIDTYKVAQLFQQKCEEEKLNYYFKVVNADRNSEYKRSDKMCIYTEFKDAEKFLEILREIKRENPDINFQTPPILTGKIDKFIGIGMDHIDNNRGSYNSKMSKICFNAVSSIFQNILREQIPTLIDRHPEMLNKLKDEIKMQAGNIGLSEEKICVKPEVKQKLEMQGKQMQNNSTIRTQNDSYTEPRDTKQGNKEQDIKDFVLKLVKSYKQLETNAQYDKRLDREESDIEYVADYVNKSRKGEIDEEYFLGLQPEELDKYGRVEFSQDNIDRMFRMLNAANNLTIGNQKYLETFCMSPEIKGLLEQMQQSPKIQEMIKVAEREKALGQQGRAKSRGLTPAEKDRIDAKVAFKEWQKSGYSDNKIFDNIIDNQHMNWGYESKEDLALARICCRQRGIRVESRALQGRYKLDIVDQTKAQDFIDRQKIKQDTIIAGVNISDITRRTKTFIDKFSRQKEDKSEEKEI